MRTGRATGLLLALFLATTSAPLGAQETVTQWRFSPFISTGAFPVSLASEVALDVNVFSPTEAGFAFPDYELTSFTGIGGSIMHRRGQFGFELTLLLIPTQAASVTDTDIRSTLENDQTFEEAPNVFLDLELESAQTLFIPALNFSYFTDAWEFGAPRFEGYFTGGVGLVTYLDDEPLGGWGGPTGSSSDFLFNLGGGLHLNVTSTMSVRIDLRDYIWSVELGDVAGNESSTQHAIVFSPGVTITR